MRVLAQDTDEKEIAFHLSGTALTDEGLAAVPQVSNVVWLNLRGLYPFYESYGVDVLIEPGRRLRLDPVVQYRDATVSWLEDFEAAGFSLEATPASQAPLTGFPAGDPGIFEGDNSGRVELASPGTKLPQFPRVETTKFRLGLQTKNSRFQWP